MPASSREYAIERLNKTRDMTLGFLEDIPDDKVTHQPVSNGNHALWVMGHLASTDHMCAGMFDGNESPLPGSYKGLFDMGSKPVGDAGAYPAAAEVRKHFDGARQRLLSAVQAADDQLLARPMPEEWSSFATDYLSMLFGLAAHEAMHAGQLTVIRRSLGLGPRFA